MKILLNGYTVTENMKLVRNKKDMQLVNKLLDHIKANKTMYLRLVCFTAILLHFDIIIYADNFGSSIDRVGSQIINMLMSVFKWGCLSMGIKDMISTILNGGSIKDGVNNGLKYLILYVFASIYPQLYDLFTSIKL